MCTPDSGVGRIGLFVTDQEVVMMRLGFTGTQRGMTMSQVQRFKDLVVRLSPLEFHHGDCVGADEEAHAIVRMVAPLCVIVIHPPTNGSKRAFCVGNRILPPREYLVRNRNIVEAVHRLAACPKSPVEQLRSGTWSTVRRARQAGLQVDLITP